MKNFKNKQTLQIVLLVVIAVVTLGVGYAAISAVNLIINGNATASVNQNNFKVHFTQAQSITGSTGAGGTSSIDTQDDTKATFDVTGLTKVGDYAEAVYTVRNDSNGIGAEITLNLESSNTEYFKVTETILDNKLQAGEETTAKVRVEMIKTPITDSVSTSVTATLTASPLEDAEATGGSQTSKEKPGTFAGDSWEEIVTNVRNNNTNMYKIGDTKEVNLGDLGIHMVRLTNKSMPDGCGSDNYSESACGFVVEFADIITTMKMNESYTNVGGYPATLVYKYLKNDLYNQLPSDLQDVIIPTKVITAPACFEATYDWSIHSYICQNFDNNGNNFVTTDKLYLFSVKEIYGSDYFEGYASSSTKQLDYYQGMEKSSVCYGGCTNYYNRAIKNYNNSNYQWWTRDPACDGSSYYFHSVSRTGILIGPGSDAFGISPAFRIG